MRNIQISLSHRWFNEVWNKSDDGAIDRLMGNDARAHGIVNPDQPSGAEGFKMFVADFRKQFKDIQIEVNDVVAQDDMESARTTVNAVHIPSGKHVQFTGMCMVRIADGKIAEAWNNYDFLGLQQQLTANE